MTIAVSVLQHSSSEQLATLLDENDKIQLVVKCLKDLQSPETGSALNRENNLPAFIEWVNAQGGSFQDVIHFSVDVMYYYY